MERESRKKSIFKTVNVVLFDGTLGKNHETFCYWCVCACVSYTPHRILRVYTYLLYGKEMLKKMRKNCIRCVIEFVNVHN